MPPADREALPFLLSYDLQGVTETIFAFRYLPNGEKNLCVLCASVV